MTCPLPAAWSRPAQPSTCLTSWTETPLHVAVRDGRAALVERLITRGADVARRDPHLGRTHEERVPRLRLLRNRDNPGDRVALAGTGK